MEYDIIDKKLNIEPSISSVRENLRREVKERAAVFIETSDSDDFEDQFEFETLTDGQGGGEETIGDRNEMVQERSDSDVTINVDVDSSSEVNESIHKGPKSKGSENIGEEENGNNDTYGQDKNHKDAMSSFEDWESGDTSDYEIEEYEYETDKPGTETKEKGVSASTVHEPVTLEKVLANMIKKHMGLDKRNDGDGNEEPVSLAKEQHTTMGEDLSDTNDYDMEKLVIKIEDTDED